SSRGVGSSCKSCLRSGEMRNGSAAIAQGACAGVVAGRSTGDGYIGDAQQGGLPGIGISDDLRNRCYPRCNGVVAIRRSRSEGNTIHLHQPVEVGEFLTGHINGYQIAYIKTVIGGEPHYDTSGGI